ncbi:hypothetical protein XA68_17340 [Ophiocordyceps unilateralis]|uniref:FAD/NAD(P)-binding domain-containing protein n=1 Tax=Ophiocordyceps unilateralis TaxID=268505 RepID=A0A2A9P4P8_OPHUN|nr:hypothetical protein XA68_17340 [Ophiocordyceps unilateralis]
MRFHAWAAFLALGQTAFAAPPSPSPPPPPSPAAEPWEYEAVIVGGGPSGLSAASGLARVRRRILLLDSAVYRNGATRHMHDVLGFDGVQPAYYRWAARKQILEYSTVKMQNGTVTRIQQIQTPSYSYFSVGYQSPTGESVNTTAAKVVLGTGLQDILPATPGFRENWGKGIYWSSNITAFVNGTDTPAMRQVTAQKTPIWTSIISRNGVTIENRTLASIERLADGGAGVHDASKPTSPELDKFKVTFTDGNSVTRDAFLVNIPNEQASTVGQDMGVQLVGGRLKADGAKGLLTNVPGVFAVGDANSDNSTNVPHALYSGKRAAVFLHVSLEREKAQRLANSGPTKRSIDEEARSVWERMNGRPGELLHAGAFDG